MLDLHIYFQVMPILFAYPSSSQTPFVGPQTTHPGLLSEQRTNQFLAATIPLQGIKIEGQDE